MERGTPEAHLEALVERLIAVRTATRFMSDEAREDFDALLEAMIRSAQTMRLLADHRVIAVAGTQSAGKTRLMRGLYDLDDAWLADNQGRGEYVPVLVIEQEGLTKPEGLLQGWSAQGGFEEPRAVSAQDFQQAVTSWGMVMALPILRVPRRYFAQPQCGFLLLPGYEEITADNKPWQQLMRLALVASNACILVTDKQRLAEQQDAIVADIRQDYLASVEPVIVITKTEDETEEHCQQLRARAAERFGVSLHATVCTGVGDADYAATWRKALSEALARCGGIGDEARQRQLDELKMFNRQIETIGTRVRKALRNAAVDSAVGEAQHDELLAIFDEAKDALQKTYVENLAHKLDAIRSTAKGQAIEDYNDNEVKLTGSSLWRMTVEAVTRDFNASDKRMGERLRTALTNAGGGAEFAAPTPNYCLKARPGNCRWQRQLPSRCFRRRATRRVNAKRRSSRSPLKRQIRSGRCCPSGSRIASARRQPLSLREWEMRSSCCPRSAPLIAMMQQGAVQAYQHDAGVKLDSTAILKSMEEAKGAGEQFLGLNTDFVKAIAGIVLVDVAVDGEANAIPALVNAILGSGGAVAAPWITGGIAAATITYSLLWALNQHQARRRDHIGEEINRALDYQLAAHIRAFEALMGELRGRLSFQIRVSLGLGEDVGQRYCTLAALQDLKMTHRRFLEAARPV
jgi:hypothetical protein